MKSKDRDQLKKSLLRNAVQKIRREIVSTKKAQKK